MKIRSVNFIFMKWFSAMWANFAILSITLNTCLMKLMTKLDNLYIRAIKLNYKLV